jgi:hypothetical protein
MSEYKQPNLFPEIREKFIGQTHQPRLEMSQSMLVQWKRAIFQYQQEVRQSAKPVQTSLFEVKEPVWEAQTIDPFQLRLHNWEFWRCPDNGDEGTYYFIIDTAVPLLLYVGETKLTAKQRWQNHDCKDYIRSYIQLHRNYDLDVAVNATFWGGIPRDRATRQKIEADLIYKWRSPFNKQCWRWWGQPFGK